MKDENWVSKIYYQIEFLSGVEGSHEWYSNSMSHFDTQPAAIDRVYNEIAVGDEDPEKSARYRASRVVRVTERREVVWVGDVSDK